MTDMPASLQLRLRRLARRLAIGLFLEIWPGWAAAGLLAAGAVTLACRMFVPAASPFLPWLSLVPIVAAVPVLVLCVMRAYRPAEVVALADWLSGGQGLLLTLAETNDRAWAESPLAARVTQFELPRLRPWRRLATLVPAAAFFVAAWALPQRISAQAMHAELAGAMTSELTATVTALKQQELITAEEEQRLEEEIERIRKGAETRVDSASWEAADAFREQVAAGVSAKQDAVKWAEESLGRYAVAAAAAGGTADAVAPAQSAELAQALERLAQQGLLANAPEELQRMLKGGSLPADARSMAQLTAALSKHLAATKGRFGELGKLGKEFGRFDPSEFPLDSGQSGADGTEPGRGAVTRGRADAPLTWGKESLPLDRFKASPLPPGAARSPDDWAPVVELPGAPQESPTLSTASAARQYAAAPGQTAWRRTLAPRHQSAVKKYFQK